MLSLLVGCLFGWLIGWLLADIIKGIREASQYIDYRNFDYTYGEYVRHE